MRTKFKQRAVDYLKIGKDIFTLEDKEKITDFILEKPTFLEIGPGKGQFILDIAAKYQSYNFLVVELDQTISGICLKKIDESGLNNVKLISGDFYKLVNIIPKSSFSGIFLNFSDPWPKRRHEKRRLTSPLFIKEYINILKDNHNIYFKSDNYNFYLYSKSMFNYFGFDILTDNQNYQILDDFDALTEFETKFKNAGIKINRLILKKGCRVKMNKLNELEKRYFDEITQIDAVSGHEKLLARYLINEYQKLGCEIYKDNFGNVLGLKRSKDPKFKVLIDGHMDEVGFIVKKINENGTIKAIGIGGIDFKAVLANRVRLTTFNEKQFLGAIDATSPHLLKGNVEIGADDLTFDFGFIDKEDAINSGVEIGNMIAFVGTIEYLNEENRILSKALDDRYGIILGLLMLHELRDVELPYDLYVGGTCQEEVGLRGVNALLNKIDFDLCIALDCSAARDTQGYSDNGVLGNGVLIRYFDRGMIGNQALLNLQKESIEKTNGKYQYFDTLGSTNAAIIHQKNILTLTHCICARSIHNASSIIDTNDFISAKNSLKYILENLNLDVIEEVKESKY